MIYSSHTYVAVPPGLTIKEQLIDRDLSFQDFAKLMEMTEERLRDLMEGEMQLTPGIAFRLEKVIGIPASFWNKREEIYRDKIEKVYKENGWWKD